MQFQVLDSDGKELETFDELTLVDVEIKYFRNQLGNRYSIESIGPSDYYDFEIRTEGGKSVYYVARSVVKD